MIPSVPLPSLVVKIRSPVPRVAKVAFELLSPIRTESALRCTSPVPSGAITIGLLLALLIVSVTTVVNFVVLLKFHESSAEA